MHELVESDHNAKEELLSYSGHSLIHIPVSIFKPNLLLIIYLHNGCNLIMLLEWLCNLIYVSLWNLILLVNQFRPMLWVNAEVIVIRTPAIECIGWWVLLNTFYLSQNACLWIMPPIHSTSIGTNWLAICSILYHLTFFLSTYLSRNRPLPLMCFHCQPT